MSDYTSQFSGQEIDALLGKVNNPDNSPTANSDNLVKSGGVKAFVEAITGLLANLNTTAKDNLVAAINEAAQTGDGGLVDITTQEDGALVFVFSDGSTITVDLNHQHPGYFSKVAENEIPSGGFLPDVAYKLGELTALTLTFDLASPVSGNINHYFFVFSTGSTAPSTVNWPSSVTAWGGNCIDENTGEPELSASKRYEVSILDGVGYISES